MKDDEIEPPRPRLPAWGPGWSRGAARLTTGCAGQAGTVPALPVPRAHAAHPPGGVSCGNPGVLVWIGRRTPVPASALMGGQLGGSHSGLRELKPCAWARVEAPGTGRDSPRSSRRPSHPSWRQARPPERGSHPRFLLPSAGPLPSPAPLPPAPRSLSCPRRVPSTAARGMLFFQLTDLIFFFRTVLGLQENEEEAQPFPVLSSSPRPPLSSAAPPVRPAPILHRRPPRMPPSRSLSPALHRGRPGRGLFRRAPVTQRYDTRLLPVFP